MSVSEVCEYLHITRATLYRWARLGRLRLYKLGERTTRVRRRDVQRMIEASAGKEAWAALSEASFARDWENERDAAYDNWRELYGVRPR